MPATAANSPRAHRLAGIDAARALALIGMLMVHFGPEDGEGLLGRLYALPHGRASLLFGVVAGIGVSLLTRRRETMQAGRVRLVAFALLLVPLGLALELLDHDVAVILHYYGGFFVLGALVAPLERRTLLAIAGLLIVLGPMTYFGLRANWPDLFGREGVSLVSSPLAIAEALLYSGRYPLLTWAAAIVWGMWLGRLDLTRRRLALVLGGAAVAAGGLVVSDVLLARLGAPGGDGDWRMLAVSAAHSQMPLWLLQGQGIATAIIGLCLYLASAMPRLMAPFAAMGRMVLTLYVLHLVLLSTMPWLWHQETVEGALAAVGTYAAAGAVLATAWQRFGRGPVEMIMHRLAAGMVQQVIPERPTPRPADRQPQA